MTTDRAATPEEIELAMFEEWYQNLTANLDERLAECEARFLFWLNAEANESTYITEFPK